MSRPAHWTWAAVAALLVVSTAACGQIEEAGPATAEPSVVEEVEGSDSPRVTITGDAADRLDLQTTEVAGAGNLTKVPAGALVVDPDGGMWVYTRVGPLTFMRHPIAIDHQDGDLVYLDEGPQVGIPVVAVGAAELYGIETGIGH
jgi:hypothetical protein